MTHAAPERCRWPSSSARSASRSGCSSRVVPQSRSVVLAVFPETEGNGVEVARALVRRYAGRVVWLRDGGPAPEDVRASPSQGMVLVPKASLAGLWAYLRAEAVLFTHGLYGSPRPCARKPIVNLWHGDGPKDVRPDRDVGAVIASTYLVGSTRLFSATRPRRSTSPPTGVLITGNPRTDQFWRPVEPRAARRARHHRRLRAVDADLPAGRAPSARSGSTATRVPPTTPAAPSSSALLDGLARPRPPAGRQAAPDGRRPAPARRGWSPSTTRTWSARASASTACSVRPPAWSPTTPASGSTTCCWTARSRSWCPTGSSYDRALLPADVLDWVPGEVVTATGRSRPSSTTSTPEVGVGAAVRHQVAERIGLSAAPPRPRTWSPPWSSWAC